MPKYYLYARKSTDDEDKQILSIESQINELREYGKRENLSIVDEYVETKTAKEPGRPIFSLMIQQIEAGIVDGILAWHPDRLARNSMDGGKIIYLVDKGMISDLRFPTYRFDATAQGKFMLSIAFGQSKYYIDSLSENVKRGLRQKLRRGEWPGYAPIGYLNNYKNHTLYSDPEKSVYLKKIFEIYSAGNHSIASLEKQMTDLGFTSRAGKPVRKTELARILRNPIYYGVFRYKGELHEASHPPLISKKLFARVQDVLEMKSKMVKQGVIKHAFAGLMKCSSCGCSITAEIQKGHTYYRCTKKRGPCDSKKFLREEALLSQIDKAILKVHIDDETKDKIINRLEELSLEESKASFSLSDELRHRLKNSDEKIERLIDVYINRELSSEEYQAKKAKLLNDKQDVKEKLAETEKISGGWLEPSKNFVSTCNEAGCVAWQGNPSAKREILKKIGSNFFLKDLSLLVSYTSPFSLVSEIDPRREWRGRRGSNPRPRDRQSRALTN
jgi:site-specific DNA recombinase